MKALRSIAGLGSLACLLLALGAGAASAKIKVIQGAEKVVPAGEQGSQKLACPKGMQVVSGGAYTGGITLEDEVSESYPFDGKDGDRLPDDGWKAALNAGPAQASVFAYVVCSNSLDLAYRSNPAEEAPDGGGQGAPACPGNSKAVGGGMEVKGSSVDRVLRASKPIVNGAAWASWIRPVTKPKKDAVAYSICADSKKIEYVTASGSLNAGSQNYVTAQCPAGTQVIGGGGGGDLDLLELASLYPDDGADDGDKPDDAWTTWYNNDGSNPSPKGISSTAVCFG